MLAIYAPIVLILGVIISFLASMYVREFRIYRYFVRIFFIHLIVGIIWCVFASLLVVDVEIYRRFWHLNLIAVLLFALEIIFFTHGNIKESLRMILPRFEGHMWIPIISLFLVAEEIMLTPGIAIAIALAGFIFALIIELMYSVSQIYSLMKGGKLFYFWRKIMLLAAWYIVFGLAYSITGVLAMSHIISYEVGNSIIASVYVIKSLLIFDLVKYYRKNLKPIVAKLAL